VAVAVGVEADEGVAVEVGSGGDEAVTVVEVVAIDAVVVAASVTTDPVSAPAWSDPSVPESS